MDYPPLPDFMTTARRELMVSLDFFALAILVDAAELKSWAKTGLVCLTLTKGLSKIRRNYFCCMHNNI